MLGANIQNFKSSHACRVLLNGGWSEKKAPKKGRVHVDRRGQGHLSPLKRYRRQKMGESSLGSRQKVPDQHAILSVQIGHCKSAF